MRNLAIFGACGATRFPSRAVEIDRLLVRSGIVRTRPRSVDAGDPANAHKVLVRVRAFSCNFRDKGFLSRMQRLPGDRFFVIGSELAGTVAAVAPGVSSLRVGDRVMTQHGFTGRGVDAAGLPEGIPTNQASKEFQWLHESQLARVPDAMSDEAAAGFGLGAQTAYSMVRKLDPPRGSRVLVTSATSNTSLYLIAALRQRDVRIVCSTTADGVDARLVRLGADQVIRVDCAADASAGSAIGRFAAEIGGFDRVFDPFFDLHLEQAVEALAPFGMYATCGFVGQSARAAEQAGIRPIGTERILLQVIAKNLSIVGNCLGLREDLETALADYAGRTMDSVVDSVFTGEDAASFLSRSFNDRARFGKVVFRYS